MIKLSNYNSFLENNRLRYSAFDWDDNILHMSTPIHMDKLVEGCWQSLSVSPAEFAIIRNDVNYRNRDNNPYKAYEEFRDIGPRGNQAFLLDVKNAIQNFKFGPSWDKFIQCLVEGSLFALVTARGHEYQTLKNGVKYIIDNCLTKEQEDLMYNNCHKFLTYFENKTMVRENNTKLSNTNLINYYLDKCKFYGVGYPFSNSFNDEFKLDPSIKIEEAKKIALDKFLNICNNYGLKVKKYVSVGFSDDDKKNVEHVKKFFEFKSTIYEHMKLNIYDTSSKISYKTKFENGIIEDMGPSISGKENSLLRFMGPNSMSNTLQNATNDWSQPNYTLLQKSKVANLLTKDSIKKKVKKLKKKNAKSKDNLNTTKHNLGEQTS